MNFKKKKHEKFQCRDKRNIEKSTFKLFVLAIKPQVEDLKRLAFVRCEQKHLVIRLRFCKVKEGSVSNELPFNMAE